MTSIQTSRKLASFSLAVVMSAVSVASMAQVMVGGGADAGVQGHHRQRGQLQGPHHATVFVPTNAAFAALPAGTVDTLLKPENKPMLTNILTYHVVADKWDAAAISKMIADGKEMATIKTVTDEKGGVAKVAIADPFALRLSKGLATRGTVYTFHVQSDGCRLPIHVFPDSQEAGKTWQAAGVHISETVGDPGAHCGRVASISVGEAGAQLEALACGGFDE